MHTPPTTPPTVDSLLRVVQAYEGEVAMLKLLVDKLKLQLLRARRAQFGPASEQLEDPQIALLQTAPLDELPAPKVAAKAEAANSDGIDRHLPDHLPRENQVHRPAATDAQRDAAGNACGCAACGGRLRQIGQDVSEQLEYVPARFKVIRHVRPKLACVACQTIFQAPAPSPTPEHRRPQASAGVKRALRPRLPYRHHGRLARGGRPVSSFVGCAPEACRATCCDLRRQQHQETDHGRA